MAVDADGILSIPVDKAFIAHYKTLQKAEEELYEEYSTLEGRGRDMGFGAFFTVALLIQPLMAMKLYWVFALASAAFIYALVLLAKADKLRIRFEAQALKRASWLAKAILENFENIELANFTHAGILLKTPQGRYFFASLNLLREAVEAKEITPPKPPGLIRKIWLKDLYLS